MHLFSVVTICRNNLNEVKRTFKSIDSQTNMNFEWIVVDGDSSDGLKEWLKNNALANWKSEPDDGIFDAMNKGLIRSTGKYLIFLNSGDEFASEDVLNKVEQTISTQSSPGFIYGDALDIDEQGSTYYRTAKDAKKNWMGMITQHQSMFFSRAAIGNSKYLLEYPITADYAFISEILKKMESEDIYKVDFPICKFDMGGTNEQQRFNAIKEDFQIRKNIIGLPWLINKPLYLLHYFHTLAKRKNPAVRFMRHRKANRN